MKKFKMDFLSWLALIYTLLTFIILGGMYFCMKCFSDTVLMALIAGEGLILNFYFKREK